MTGPTLPGDSSQVAGRTTTLWDAYLLLLARLGFGRRPALPDAAESGQAESLEQALASLRSPAASGPSGLLRSMRVAQGAVWRWMGAAVGIAFALAGQLRLVSARDKPEQGIALLALGGALLIAASWRGVMDERRRLAGAVVGRSQPDLLPLPRIARREIVGIRLAFAAVGAACSLLTYLSVGDNDFTPFGRVTWTVSLIAWLAAFWESPPGEGIPSRVAKWWREGADLPTAARQLAARLERAWQAGFAVRATPTMVLLLAVMAASAYFRFARLTTVPIAMTSDHVEKLVDVNDIVTNGKRPIFEPANGGREPMQFYLAAIAARLAGTGISHLTLKLVASATGFLTLPFIFLLARELSDDDLAGLLATLAAGIAWWPNVISRNGLRFPLAPLFGTIALWLIVRAVRRGRRNDALLAGLALGIGMYGYTPIRAVPLAALLALGLHALHRRTGAAAVRAAGWAAMLSVVLLAGLVPFARYAVDDPESFWSRTFTRITGDPDLPAVPTWRVFLDNEWNSVRMFSWTADSAWLVSPAGQPALDWIMGALFALGVAYVAYRYARWRNWLDLFLLAAIPVLLLPSTLALAFPIENPSLHRSGAAIPLVFIIVAIPLRLLIEHSRDAIRGWAGTGVGLGLAGLLLFASGQANWNILFVRYADQYKSSVQNASEIGAIVRTWAETIGSWDTVTVRAYPHWVDTRAVGIYAGQFGWNNVVLDPAGLANWVDDPRPKLYILRRYDLESVAELRRLYPEGQLAYHASQFYDKDFLTFFVPGTADFDEAALGAP